MVSDALRRPPFIVALVMIVLALLVELGSPWLVGGGAAPVEQLNASFLSDDLDDDIAVIGSVEQPPGRGIPAMALLDGVLTFRIALMGAALVIPARILGRGQGCLTAILCILLLLGGIVSLFSLIVELSLMVGLFLSSPWGTIAYLAVWGFFPRADAAVILSLLLFLKIAMVIFLVIAQPKFLQIKALVALVLTSLLANLILAFLHGLMPNPVRSIADEIGAIVVVILGLIWAVLMLIGSIWGIVKALRFDRALAR